VDAPDETHVPRSADVANRPRRRRALYTSQNWPADVQLPDGTVVWTSPASRRWSAKSIGALFILILDATPASPASVANLARQPQPPTTLLSAY
jgi:hypothetical protein